MIHSYKIFSWLFLAAGFICGCSDSSTTTTTENKSLSLSLSGLYPSRSGETYALWLEFPKSAALGKQNRVQHGMAEAKLVSAFRVEADGSVSGFDTTNLVAKLANSLALAEHGIISVEKIDSIKDEPRDQFLAGEISGTPAVGTAVLSTGHEDALNYDFTGMTTAITLANAPGKPANDLELYLMRATSQTQTSSAFDNLPLLPDPWHYALWAVDSSTKSLPPFNIYYGTFASPIDVDSHPEDNHYKFPGGRYPADSTQTSYDLRSGKTGVMVTLEPITDGVRPSVPFGAIILQTTISATAQPFFPIELTNRAALFPRATITIHR